MRKSTYQTSEKVNVQFSLASPFQRMVAYILDTIFKYVTVFIFLIILALAGIQQDFLSMFFTAKIASYLTIAYLIIIGLFFFCYSLIFEFFYNGQTPGKMILNIRVIMDDGQTVTLTAVILRNIFRIIDFLPVYYIIGLLTMFISKKYQRVGDMAAGTIVVCEERIPIPLAEVDINLTPNVLVENLSLHQSIRKAIEIYCSTYKDITKESIFNIQKMLITKITESTGIQKPVDINDHDFIFFIYRGFFKSQ